MTDKKYPEPDYDFQGDLAIDKHALDDELVAQARKMMRYSMAHAQAQLDRDRAKQRRDLVEAELDKKARQEHEALGLPSSSRSSGPTEATVLNWIRSQPKYKKAQEERLEAEYKVNVLFGAVMAMNARRQLLEDLVRLYLSSYWSTPRQQPGGQLGSQSDTEEAILRAAEGYPSVEQPEQKPRPTPTPIRPTPSPAPAAPKPVPKGEGR